MATRIWKESMGFGTAAKWVWAMVLSGLFACGAPAETKIRFSLDWIPGATHGPFLIALYKGYYKAEGLDVTIDRGKGSGEVVRQLAAGTYDMGFPDINILADFNAKNPAHAMREVLMGHEQAAAAIVFLKSAGISAPKDLEGKALGSAINDSTFKLFPLFAKFAGIEAAKVKTVFIDPSLREVLLARRDVDAIPGQVFNAVMELQAKGVAKDNIGLFMYRDHGLDIYGNGIAVGTKFLKEQPEAVKGFLRATVKGARGMARDPEAAVQAALQFEPLLNPAIERQRLALAMDCCILTPKVKGSGYGGVDMARLKRTLGIVAQGYNLPREPVPEEMFDPSFLPDEKDRMLE
jgi:NitT/TauT family transport system substrate-binding protein